MEGRLSEACQFDTFLHGGMRCRPTARYGPAQKTSCPRQTGIRKNGQEAKPVGTEFSVDTVHTRLCAEGPLASRFRENDPRPVVPRLTRPLASRSPITNVENRLRGNGVFAHGKLAVPARHGPTWVLCRYEPPTVPCRV